MIGLIVLLAVLTRIWGLASFPPALYELVTYNEAEALFDRSRLFSGIESRAPYFMLQHTFLPAT